jgi:hypothetical protein
LAERLGDESAASSHGNQFVVEGLFAEVMMMGNGVAEPSGEDS